MAGSTAGCRGSKPNVDASGSEGSWLDASVDDASVDDASVEDVGLDDHATPDAAMPDSSATDGSLATRFPPNVVVVVDPDQVTGADLGLTSVYEMESLLDSVSGRLNEDTLRVVYGKRNQPRSPAGLWPWLEEYVASSPSRLSIQTLSSSEELLRLASEFFDEIITYPPNPVDWSYDGNAIVREMPKGDGRYTWVDEKYNFNRYLALNFVHQRRALPVPEDAAGEGSKLRAWMSDKPIRSLREVINGLEPTGWRQWREAVSAHRFILQHVAPTLNPNFVCVNTAFDVCVLEGGLSVGPLRASLYSPLDALLLDEILGAMSHQLPQESYGSLVGWSGEERIFGCIASKNRYGVSLEIDRGYAALHQMAVGTPNLDLNDHIVEGDLTVEQRTYDPSRHYAALIFSDGNPDQALGRHGGAWAAYHSGQFSAIPLTWQVRPSVLSYAPILAQYLRATRFPTDAFMMGPSGPLYVHFTGLGAAVDAYGTLVDQAGERLGLRMYETWAGYHPRVDDIFESPTDPDNAAAPNPFPSLYADITWPGNPRELLSSILVCRPSEEDARAFPYSASFDRVRSSTRRIDAVIARSPFRQEDIFDDRPTAFLHHPLGLWNNYPRDLQGDLDVAAVGDALFRYYGASGQFALFTAYPYESDMKAGITMTDMERVALHFESRGVTLVTMEQYLALKRQCLILSPSTNSSCR